jgi:multidrug efflux pump subunit AcrA (membrane-fusion protein)
VPEGVLPKTAPEATLGDGVKAPTGREHSFSSGKPMDRRVTTAAGLSTEHGSKSSLKQSGRFSDVSAVSGGLDASTLFMKELQQDKARMAELDEDGDSQEEEEQEENPENDQMMEMEQANRRLTQMGGSVQGDDNASVMDDDMSRQGDEMHQTRGGALMSKHTRNMQRAVPEKVEELRTQYLKTPKVTVGHLSHYTRWINSLHIWEDEVEPSSVSHALQTGLLLCSLMKHLVPETRYLSLNQKPRSRKPMMQNIEQGLAVVHQKGSNVNTRRIPAAEQVYLGKPKQVALLLGEVFECFVMKDVYDHIKRGDLPKSDRRAKAQQGPEQDGDEWKSKMVKVKRQGVRSRISAVLAWMDRILKEYDAPLPATTMKPVELMERENSLMLELHETKEMIIECKAKMSKRSGGAREKLQTRLDSLKEDHQSIVMDLQELRKMPDHRMSDESLEALFMYMRSGTALFLLIRHFNGEANRVGRAGTPVDSRRMRRDPMDDSEVENNLFYVFALLSALQIPLLWAPTQFAHERSDEFLMLQLDYIHHYFHTQPCALSGEEGLVWREDLADQIVSQEVDRLNQDLGRSMGMDMDLSATKRAVTDRQMETNADRGGWNGSVGGKQGGSSKHRALGSQAHLMMATGNRDPSRVLDTHREGERLRRMVQQGQPGGDEATWARNRMEMHAESQESLADVESQQARLAEEKSQLEIDRQLRDLDLQREEVALETEYYQLGEQVNELDPDEYDNLLDSLERQRFQLEEGRRQFEEEYAGRQQQLDMQELQLEEARVNAQRAQEQGMGATMTGSRRSPKKTVKPKQNRAEAQDKEKGWNRNTHKNMTSTRKYDNLNSTKREAVDYEATATRFQSQTQAAALSSSGRGPISRHPPMNTQPGGGGQVRMQQPEQAGASNGGGAADAGGSQVSELQRAIRDEERRLMAVEEERRWLYMEQQADTAESAASPAGHATVGGGGGAAFQEQSIEVELPQTPEDLREALDWLKEPKVLSLKERNSERQFEYALFEQADTATGNLDYQLIWYANGNPSDPEGLVLLSDIDDIKAAPSDATLFTLVLKKNKPQAVRNSGGLHIVCIRARSAPECAMYRSGLLGLMATL